MDSSYAESVALTAYSEDARTTLDVRLARFPGKHQGALWLFAYVDEVQYALVDEALALSDQAATTVAADTVRYVVEGISSADFRAENRHGDHMRGWLTAAARVHEQAHPDPGPGGIDVGIEAEFRALHEPIRVRPGRIEVMGRVRARVSIEGEERVIDLPGKWHEQSGPRPEFAPAFTYLFVQGASGGIMLTHHAQGAWGYVFRNDSVIPVRMAEIDPYGSSSRSFTLLLADGDSIQGQARVVREVSVPIEGSRRPGATVLVDGNMGPMVGMLNDWKP